MLIHAEIGVALLDLDQRRVDAALAALERLLAQERVAHEGETLPVVGLALGASAIAEVGERLAASFESAERCDMCDRRWPLRLMDTLLTAEDAAMAPLGPLRPERDAPPPPPERDAPPPAAHVFRIEPEDAPLLHDDGDNDDRGRARPRRMPSWAALALGALILAGGGATAFLLSDQGASPPPRIAAINRPLPEPPAPAATGYARGAARARSAAATPSPTPPAVRRPAPEPDPARRGVARSHAAERQVRSRRGGEAGRSPARADHGRAAARAGAAAGGRIAAAAATCCGAGARASRDSGAAEAGGRARTIASARAAAASRAGKERGRRASAQSTCQDRDRRHRREGEIGGKAARARKERRHARREEGARPRRARGALCVAARERAADRRRRSADLRRHRCAAAAADADAIGRRRSGRDPDLAAVALFRRAGPGRAGHAAAAARSARGDADGKRRPGDRRAGRKRHAVIKYRKKWRARQGQGDSPGRLRGTGAWAKRAA